jgi:hypothetical protein
VGVGWTVEVGASPEIARSGRLSQDVDGLEAEKASREIGQGYSLNEGVSPENSPENSKGGDA